MSWWEARKKTRGGKRVRGARSESWDTEALTGICGTWPMEGERWRPDSVEPTDYIDSITVAIQSALSRLSPV